MERKWSFQAEDYIWAQPVFSEGVIYFPADRHLYAIEGATGRVLWRFSPGLLSRLLRPLTPSSVAVGYAERLYFGLYKNLYCVQSTNGKEIWRFPIGDTLFAGPIAGGHVYFADKKGYVHAIDGGETNWTVRLNRAGHLSPLAIDNSGTIACCLTPRELYALDCNTGSVLWKRESSSSDDVMFESPSIYERVVYVGGEYLQGFDLYSGNKTWEFVAEHVTRVSQPIVANGVVYFSSYTGRVRSGLHAVEVQTGEEKWSTLTHESSSMFPRRPVVSDRFVCVEVGTDTGVKVRVVNIETGYKLWESSNGDDTFPCTNGDIFYTVRRDTLCAWQL